MGMYREIAMPLRCQHCGSEHRASVQFKTDHDTCEMYTGGEIVLDLPANGEWEGITDRFCGSCYVTFCGDRELAMASVLAAFVSDGRLVLGPGEGQTPLTSDTLLAIGERHADAARRSHVMSSPPTVLREVDPKGRDTRPDDVRRALFEAHHEEMRRRGWPLGDDAFREDIVVSTDAQRRIEARLVSL